MSSRPLRPVLLDLLNFAQTAQQTLITKLNDTEREVPGTLVRWSVRDHVAHLTFWKQHLSRHLDARHRTEMLLSKGDFGRGGNRAGQPQDCRRAAGRQPWHSR